MIVFLSSTTVCDPAKNGVTLFQYARYFYCSEAAFKNLHAFRGELQTLTCEAALDLAHGFQETPVLRAF